MLKTWIKTLKCGFKRCIGPKDINKKQLDEMVKQGITLIDVRSQQEYKEGHLDGAICIPSYEIEKIIEDIIPNKEEKFILYCDSGARSKKAQKILEKIGYTNVYNLYEGRL